MSSWCSECHSLPFNRSKDLFLRSASLGPHPACCIIKICMLLWCSSLWLNNVVATIVSNVRTPRRLTDSCIIPKVSYQGNAAATTGITDDALCRSFLAAASRDKRALVSVRKSSRSIISQGYHFAYRLWKKSPSVRRRKLVVFRVDCQGNEGARRALDGDCTWISTRTWTRYEKESLLHVFTIF
jgi:hypothetical protein